MKLYTYYRSSAAFRVRIALNVKGVAYESIPKHLVKQGGEHLQADYLAANPQGLIPALEDNGAVIGQSLAIIEYLEERFPTPALLPTDLLQRAQVRGMALGIVCDLHPLHNLRVTNYLAQQFGHSDQDINEWRWHWIGRGLQVLEELVRRHSTDGLHCFGDAVTLADVCLLPQIFTARRFKFDLAPFPLLTKIGNYLETLPAFANARPEVQPDAE